MEMKLAEWAHDGNNGRYQIDCQNDMIIQFSVLKIFFSEQSSMNSCTDLDGCICIKGGIGTITYGLTKAKLAKVGKANTPY